MHKDTIYIEPDNDITDIIAKIKASSQRIIALVPPKKSVVLKSAINVRLIAKAANEFDKVVVLITVDPAIMKLAMNTRIPVAESLQSTPSVPTQEMIEKLTQPAYTPESVTEEFLKPPETVDKILDSTEPQAGAEKSSDEITLTDTEVSESGDPAKTEESAKQEQKTAKKSKIPNFDKYRKWIIISGVAVIFLVVFLVWALVIAPRADVTVSVHSTANNFSETISFTNQEKEEDSSTGKFYLDQRTFKDTAETEFTATGSKDIGEKAKGNLVVFARFKDKATISIPAGSSFTHNDLRYTSTADAKISYGGTIDECENKTDPEIIINGCRKSASVPIVAVEPGDKYNLADKTSGWDTNSVIKNSSEWKNTYSSAITGGTTNIITIVQQSDINSAKDKLKFEKESIAKKKLYADISDTTFIIESSYKVDTSEPKSSIAVDAEVKGEDRPKLSMTMTYSVYVLDFVRIEEFIKVKAKIPEDQKIYSLGEPFIENFREVEGGYSAKLKTAYHIGPNITEQSIFDQIAGHKIGEAQRKLKEGNGINAVSIDTPFFWIRKVPTNPDRVTITIKEERQ